MIYSTRRFVVCLSMCHFVLVFFSPFSIAITSLGEERANLSAFRTFVRFVLVLICRSPLPLGAWEGLRFVIVALPGLFSYPFFMLYNVYNENMANILSFSIYFKIINKQRHVDSEETNKKWSVCYVNCSTLSLLNFWNELFRLWIWTHTLLQIEVSVKNQ